MRIAFVSPMPPARSGIADYSAALCAALCSYAEVDVVSEAPARFDPLAYDAVLYQLGNNPWHVFVYDLALQHSGVSVMHEANLHHLLTDVTIRRNRWDQYVEEAEYNGGPEALAFAKRVQALEVGPDYDNLPMTRRLLERSRGLVVHSRFVGRQMRQQGFQGPIAVIPHGAWIPAVDRLAARHRLGLDERTSLIGVFGYLKPYKRIAESLRAFRRLLRFEPSVKMLLAGEVHPDFPLASMVQGMGLSASVRLTGHTSIEDFETYIAASDIVLNLRYPTVGETSGTLLRSLGLGRAVIVSDVGSFSELPGDICLKAPVDSREEDTLFEYLHLLVQRRDLAVALGDRARTWVQQECSWDHVASLYANFLSALNSGTAWPDFDQPLPSSPPPPPAPPVEVPISYIAGWSSDEGARSYIETHKTRLEKTLEMTPPGTPDSRILEMGAYLQITPALKTRLGYGEVRGCYFGPAGAVEHKRAVSGDEVFECSIELFDAEKDPFPYPDSYFSTILCGELLEHLSSDPMHMMAEINRVLVPGGHLLLTTPNIASTRALAALLRGYHPGFFPAYLRPELTATDARHNREYTPNEIWLLFHYSGFDMVRLETGEFQDAPHPQHHYVENMLKRYGLSTDLRGDGIYALGRKSGPVRERFPGWLYSGGS